MNNLTPAHYKVEFGFGIGKDRNQRAIPGSEQVAALDFIAAEAARRFGAYTLTSTSGGWTNPAGLLVQEPGYTLMATVPANFDCLDLHAKIFAAYIAGALRQEAVAVTVTPVWFFMQFVSER